MFLIIGVHNGETQLAYTQNIICPHCGSMTSVHVFMTYMVFNLFFIPIFKWHKRYYVRMSACGASAELDPAVGKAIARGEQVQIRAEDLYFTNDACDMPKYCKNCGYSTRENFQYCPKCGYRMD